MSNSFFQFKQFTIHQDRSAMKVTTDACLFGAWAANEICQDNGSASLLDAGTGTGLLSLMIAQKNPLLNTDAVEIDGDTADQASENIKNAPWKDSITLFNKDIRHFTFSKKYDCIISNPPFYENELESGDAKKDTAHHSKDLRLTELLTIMKANLVEQGIFYLLLPYKRNEEIHELLKKAGLFIITKLLVRQTVNHDYFRILLKGTANKNRLTEEKEMSIRDDQQQYTEEFKLLLKDYYLYL